MTDVSYGDVLTTDVRLQEDLTCAGDVLSVGAHGIRMSLNGHVISGNGNGITVRPCFSTVRAAGNLVTGSAAGIKFGTGWTGNLITDNTFATNTCGLSGPGTSNTYRDNVFASNTMNICP